MDIPLVIAQITTEPITINNQTVGHRLHAYAYDESVGLILLGCKEVTSKEEVAEVIAQVKQQVGGE